MSQIIAGSELIMQKFLGILRNSAQFVATHCRRAFRNGGAGSRLKKMIPLPLEPRIAHTQPAGSDSDLPTMRAAAEVLKQFEVRRTAREAAPPPQLASAIQTRQGKER